MQYVNYFLFFLELVTKYLSEFHQYSLKPLKMTEEIFVVTELYYYTFYGIEIFKHVNCLTKI